MLEGHPDIHPDTIFLFFDGFSENGPELFLYFFTKTTIWKEYLKVKEDVNLADAYSGRFGSEGGIPVHEHLYGKSALQKRVIGEDMFRILYERRLEGYGCVRSLFTRRSIRRYTGEPISEEDLGFC